VVLKRVNGQMVNGEWSIVCQSITTGIPCHL
jgi:hypothetical protein